jgi:hypothetical protein
MGRTLPGFTPDAVIDYTVSGRPNGKGKDLYPQIKLFLAEALPRLAYAQHIISVGRIRLDGDRATGRTIYTNPVGVRYHISRLLLRQLSWSL